MKQTCAAILLAINLCICTVSFGTTDPIPYPTGLDTKSQGASAAPAEINHPSSPYYTHPDFYQLTSTATLTILPHYRTYQQTTEENCAPAAGLTVMYYYGHKNISEPLLTKGMKTYPYPIGTSLTNMANYFTSIGWKTETSKQHKPFQTYSEFQAFALKNLKEGTPILVESVYWGGHWRVLIGYDTLGTPSTLDDTLIFADPYDTCDHLQDGYAIENGEQFYATWFDHSMLPKSEANQPWIITKPC